MLGSSMIATGQSSVPRISIMYRKKIAPREVTALERYNAGGKIHHNDQKRCQELLLVIREIVER